MLLKLKYFFLWRREMFLSMVVVLLILEWWTLDMAHHWITFNMGSFCLGFCFSGSHKSVGWVSLNMLPTHLGGPYGDVPGGGDPFALQHQGYMFSKLMLVVDKLIFCPWVFVPKITTSPGTERTTSLSTAWLTLQPSSSFRLYIYIYIYIYIYYIYKLYKRVLSWPANWSDWASPTTRLTQ